MIRASDRILGPARGTAAKWIAIGTSRGVNRLGEFTSFVSTVYDLAPKVGIDPALVVAQAFDETGNFTNKWWTERLNSGSLGVTGDPQDDAASPNYQTGTDAARAQIVHLWMYCMPGESYTDPEFVRTHNVLAPYFDLDPRMSAVAEAGWEGDATILSDLNNRWAANPTYGQDIAQRGNELYGDLPDQDSQTGGTPTVSQYTRTIPGLPGGPLVTDYPIDTATFMLPTSNTRQRPGIPAQTPRRSVQHGTGNPNSLARDDASWVHGGADGIQESMHFECDDLGCFQLVPVNEVTWQAADGSGPGNMNGVSCEMTESATVWGNPARRDRAIHVVADLLGRISARLNIAVPEQHYTFNFADPNRHDCPNKLRHTMIGNQTAWDALYVPAWNAAKADELTRINGGTVTPTTTPAPKPTTQYPPGMDEGVASWLFGSAKGKDGKTYSFNPTGVVSQAWLKYGDLWGFGELRDVWKFSDGREYFKFTTMTLWRTGAKADFVPLETAQP